MNKNLTTIILLLCVLLCLVGFTNSDFYSVIVKTIGNTEENTVSCMDSGNLLIVTGYKNSGVTEQYTTTGKSGIVDCNNHKFYAEKPDVFKEFVFDIDGNISAGIVRQNFKFVTDTITGTVKIYLPIIVN